MSENEQVSEYRKEWTLTILKLMYARQNHWGEIKRITGEINESLDRNDRVSTQMLLEMRGEEIEHIDENMRQLQLFKEHLTDDTQKEIDQLFEGKMTETEDEYSAKIIDTVKNCRKLVDEIIVMDKRMSKRIAGADSFYK